MRTLGENIRKLRRQRNWSQEDVANRLNISIAAFSKIETGVTDINLSRLKTIAAVFDLSVIQLLAYDDPAYGFHSSTLEALNKKLKSREIEVVDLQKKVINLFEEVRMLKTQELSKSPISRKTVVN
ncbi:Helix-turn-helix domain-containing protein [Mucilaginibacter gossypiicola]|uniref:Helix-turn-helix domain-containing protein n=1 Tax=Mucilaginibacter gossypiicola TaxID=551995 RepID=A0A1H8U802_9SPHI|nr:helix-turn-helix transcriptional regulator [Mucilaginibacter gossypiicola]SEO99311.1 Helix-turn-helix domain-containing protein [Mucilaginibacter gossypiicola]